MPSDEACLRCGAPPYTEHKPACEIAKLQQRQRDLDQRMREHDRKRHRPRGPSRWKGSE